MNLKEHYDQLYQNAKQQIEQDAYSYDELIDSKNDKRRGITLLIRPDDKVKAEILKFLHSLKGIEPNQYFYPESDLHITIMSIISCYKGFDLGNINIEDYIKVIRQSITDIKSFTIEFKGITASPSCVMIQGFMANNTLNQIRDNLRTHFKNSTLQQSLDKRYTIQTAHSTVFRIREKLAKKTYFLKLMDEYRNHNFGTFTVDQLEFVYNDWYQRKEHVKTLHQFKLGKNAYVSEELKSR